jgi:glycosyltransferase involved in cell wall biosynthesis
MQKLSVVIVCRNEADVIGPTLKSLAALTEDIVVFDNGSADGTQQIVKQSGGRFFEGSWEGFGKTKNKANALAKYDWILSLDADEAIDEEMKNSLLQLNLQDDKTVYELRFKNFLGTRWLRFGAWGNDRHIRLFNRKLVQWDDAAVHESLIISPDAATVRLKGYVLHRTAAGVADYEKKIREYAGRGAEKYFQQGKRSGWLKMNMAAFLSFIKNYFLKLGFLDGKKGFDCARINALYTFLKYKKLKELTENRE